MTPPDGPHDLHLTEVQTLRAMAHPLRMRIIGSLRVDGPATSAVLARRLGTDSGQTSHHLRLLARYGFVVEAPELGKGPRGRERWWRAATRSTYWTEDLDRLGPDGAGAVRALADAARRVWDNLVDTYRDQVDRGEWEPAWRDAAGAGDMVVRLTPERLTAMRDEIEAVVARHDLTDRSADGAESVVVVLQAYPRRVVE
ncbi:winged helix-turn-helix domain-containing protein [Jidongwangia harbinensis]|uniref:winged helix-turn-helix domain-containing protein n=1 Tax=Jidongwangia harbinensis TaxID=2878561 RepID=UPI001CDA0F64|nr:helix-turn-helix domain-containing protein [Jidongwangia harbinensis]MCA2212142.1 helix-turn-helix domain-containing protein [Jidongwangia harbinensis]